MDLWTVIGEETIEDTITRRKLIVNNLRKSRQVLTFNMPGNTKVSRLQNTWKKAYIKR